MRGLLIVLTIVAASALAPTAKAVATTDESVRIGWVSDAQEEGARPGLRAITERFSARAVDILLYGGDTTFGYGDMPQDWLSAVGPFRTRENLLYVYGTHDGGAGYGAYAPSDGVTRWWSGQVGPALVIAIDSTSSLAVDSPQWQWLVETLAGHENDTIIVANHVPWWVPNIHHTPELGMVADVAALDALFERTGVDLVLAGHEHYYARMDRANVTYVVTGPGEAPTRTPPTGVPFDRVAEKVTSLVLDVTASGITLVAYDENGAVFDGVTIKARADTLPPPVIQDPPVDVEPTTPPPVTARPPPDASLPDPPGVATINVDDALPVGIPFIAGAVVAAFALGARAPRSLQRILAGVDRSE